jgi:histidyl-tRNA synthetase
MLNKNKFWNRQLLDMSNFIKLYFSILSVKYNFNYQHYPIYLKLNSKEEADVIIGDCYKQVLHLSTKNRYLGIMRPEFTHMASQNINLNSENIYYIGDCYRNETTQFLRYQNFIQLGCELFCNTYDKSKIMSFITLSNVYEMMLLTQFNNKSKYVLYVNTKDKDIINFVEQRFNNFNVELNNMKRVGGEEHAYTDICFEVHAYSIDKTNQKHEIFGGGSYNIKFRQNNIFSNGYAIGLERFLYYICNNCSEQDRLKLISFITKKYTIIDMEENIETQYLKIYDIDKSINQIMQFSNIDKKITFKLIK